MKADEKEIGIRAMKIDMIKKLRIKFIILSTVSLLLLLGIIVISSNFLAYRELVFNSDRVIEMIADNGGRPGHKLPPEKKENPMPNIVMPSTGVPSTGMDNTVKRHDGFWSRRTLSLETMYEARFFTVTIAADGQITAVNTESIAMVDENDAEKYAELVKKKKHDRGFINDFRYVKFAQGNDTYVIFLDCGRSLFTFRNSLYTNCLISFAGLLAIGILIVVFSKRIVQPAAESYEKQKQFISVAGHEIRTPLTIIDADAEILSMEIGDDNEWLQDICAQTKRMSALTDNLLRLSRMDENRQQFTMIDFPISDVISETVQSFQTLARSRGRSIKADITPMLSCYGDEGGVRQIAGILLDNAIKYTKEREDGSCDTIVLTLEKKNHTIVLSVQNSAETVSDEQLEHFFDRFYRTEQTRSLETGGYGLGLSIAKSIAEAHKGRITASAPGVDMVQITVTLPQNGPPLRLFGTICRKP